MILNHLKSSLYKCQEEGPEDYLNTFFLRIGHANPANFGV